jgi:hypothetical protein
MALDAFVYCDCFEKDNLRSNPPAGLSLTLSANGELSCDASDEAGWYAFNTWNMREPAVTKA